MAHKPKKESGMRILSAILNMVLVFFVGTLLITIGSIITLFNKPVNGGWKRRREIMRNSKAYLNEEVPRKIVLEVLYSGEEDGTIWNIYCDGHVDHKLITEDMIHIALLEASVCAEDMREIQEQIRFEHSYMRLDSTRTDVEDYPWFRCEADHPDAKPITAWWP